jgi:Family of unknown function (DUF5762)
MTTPFWSNDPTIIFNKESITQLWPLQKMTFEEKLNAISRLVILMSLLGFLFTRNGNLIIIALITLAIIFSLYKLRKQKIVRSLLQTKEGFAANTNTMPPALTQNSITTNPVTLESVLRTNFHPTTKKNPFGNVLLTDIMDEPDRRSAAPSFNPDVYDDITKVTKKQTQMLYPDIKNTNKQLYGDLYDNYQFDTEMMQRFYSMPNTRVANDQGAFGSWLYGNMPSGKSSGPDGAFARTQDNWRWIMI